MDVVSLVVLFLAGCVTGFLAGLFGVGGGIILVPTLLWYFSEHQVSSLVATHLALGTSLLVVTFTSLSSSIRYSRNGHIIGRAVLFIGLASIVGAFLGSGVAASLQGRTLQEIFGGVVGVSAIRLLLEGGKTDPSQSPDVTPKYLLLTGLITGLVSSLAGVGGGVLSIPIMYHLLSFPLKKAIGTSSATIVVTALAAVAGYIFRGWGNPLLPGNTLGFVDYLHAAPLIVGSLPFAILGAKQAHLMQVHTLRKVFAVFLMVVAIRILMF